MPRLKPGQVRKRTGGRPYTFNGFRRDIADLICARIANGESLLAMCKEPGMPAEATVRSWVIDNKGADDPAYPGFALAFSRAREMGCDSIAEQIIQISDEDITFEGKPDNALVQQARLRSDNRKWYLSKIMPKRFGDKVTQEITGDANAPIVTRIELVPVEPVIRHTTRTIDYDDAAE